MTSARFQAGAGGWFKSRPLLVAWTFAGGGLVG